MAEGTVAADQLRLFVERIERLEEEKKSIADDIRDVYAEAKVNGYDIKTMRSCVRLRKLETHTRQEQDALLETYRAALGMDLPYSQRSPQAKDKTPIEKQIEAQPLKEQVFAKLEEAGFERTGDNTFEAPSGTTTRAVQPDEIYAQAIALVTSSTDARVSPLMLSHKLRTTYEGADAFLQRMETEGIVGAADAMNRREVLASEKAVSH